MRLKGKNIVIGITGSVSAVESVKMVRELKRRGANTVSVLTRDARKIIHPNALEFASDRVITDFKKAEHVELMGFKGCGDLLLIAPATANTISKIANKIADTNVTLLALTALGSKKPVLVAPAMHLSMFRAIEDKLRTLEEMGIGIISPRIEEEKAKLASIEEICLHVERSVYSREFKGKKVVVTSGPTFEFIDPIRFISNKSSGRMGNELALEFWRRGAEVVLISSKPPNLNLPDFRIVRVVSVMDMLKEVLNEVGDADLFVSASAPSDFVVEKLDEKIKTSDEYVLRLKSAPKIIKEVRRVYDGHIIGFKAETGIKDEELIRIAKNKMEEDRLEVVVANDVKERGMGTEDTRVVVVTDRRVEWVEGLKDYVAKRIVDIYVEDYL